MWIDTSNRKQEYNTKFRVNNIKVTLKCTNSENIWINKRYLEQCYVT